MGARQKKQKQKGNAHHGGGDRARSKTISAIHAPYNFVPLHERIFTPEWAGEVSHDRPFADGLCGELELAITARTPILVGNERKQGQDGVGEVYFHEAPDGRYMIPGSALRGMVRNVLEVAAFGRMRFVDNRRLSVRDLTSGARSIYGNRMTKRCGAKPGEVWDRKKREYVERNDVPVFSSRARAGWLMRQNGKVRLIPCQHARIQHDELDRHVQGSMKGADSAMVKYELWERAGNSVARRFRIEKEKAHLHKRSGMYLRYALAHIDDHGDREGMLVFTGQPSPKKHMEFVFHSPGDAFDVPDDVWKSFNQVHEESEEWKYWRKAFQQGRKVPVFYLGENGTIQAMGLAMMFRLPYRHSVHDAVGHTSADHLANEWDDLPALIFGFTDQDQGHASFRGRAWFSPAFAEGSPREDAQQPTILNGPKPSYYPNYIEQDQEGGKLKSRQYRTLMDGDCRIRGFKRYPARSQAQPQPLTKEQEKNRNVQTRLFPLEAGATFRGRLVFHNLKPEELGALVWALTWGGEKRLRHSIGMGKPFGLGQVSIRIQASDIRANDPGAGAPSLDECRDAFRRMMEAWSKEKMKKPWMETPQIRNLLAMADPERAKDAPGGKLAHMRLNGPRDNQFQEAKKGLLVLAEYAPSGKPPAREAARPGRPGGLNKPLDDLKQGGLRKIVVRKRQGGEANRAPVEGDASGVIEEVRGDVVLVRLDNGMRVEHRRQAVQGLSPNDVRSGLRVRVRGKGVYPENR